MRRPDIYAYANYRTYLRDWFRVRQSEDPQYSHGRFAAEAGCSRGALANVLSGARTPRPATLDAFSIAIGLDPDQRNFLGHLVDLEKTATTAARRRVHEALLSDARYRQVRVSDESDSREVDWWFSRWYHLAISELATLPGFREDPEWIAAQLRPAITPDEAAEALRLLLEFGMLQRNEDATLKTREGLFRTPPEADHPAVARFHREVVPELLGTLDTSLSKVQNLSAMTILLTPNQVAEAKQRVNELLEGLAAMVSADGPQEGRRVYQMAIQLLPVTEVIVPQADRDDQSSDSTADPEGSSSSIV